MIAVLKPTKMILKTNNSRVGRNVRTSLSLSKTRPSKEKKIQKLKQSLAREKSKLPEGRKVQSLRTKPESRIEMHQKLENWLIPARIAYLLNGLYFLGFSVVSFIGVFGGFNVIRPFFTLPFETSFSSVFLLEIAALFAFLVTQLYFYAARHPWHMRWFYFLLILVVFPYRFLSNFQKMQIELPQDFLNYLYFDTILMAVLWLCFLFSLYPYLKQKKQP